MNLLELASFDNNDKTKESSNVLSIIEIEKSSLLPTSDTPLRHERHPDRRPGSASQFRSTLQHSRRGRLGEVQRAIR
jgi:hypothetical protein